jgi:ArsR family transcriptional regulator
MSDSNHIHPPSSLPLDPEEAAVGFAALGSEQRLDVLRFLVRAGPEGLSVGALKSSTGLAASTLSHHIRFLAQTGLMVQEKQGRRIICRADFERIESLAAYLTRECCADAADVASHDHADHNERVKP